jgi:hypothetical protein
MLENSRSFREMFHLSQKFFANLLLFVTEFKNSKRAMLPTGAEG